MPKKLPSTRDADVERVRLACGPILRDRIRELPKGKSRRPLLATLAKFKKPAVSEYLGISITQQEWNLTRKHALCPGPWVEAFDTESHRCRISDTVLYRLYDFLNHSSSDHSDHHRVLQQNAFGERLRSIVVGGNKKKNESDQLEASVRKTAVKFIMAMAAEDERVQGVVRLSDAERCECVQKDTFLRCRRASGHVDRCNFTDSKNAMSLSSATRLVDSLSEDQLKSLAGLDDDYEIIQGRENFIRIKGIAERLCSSREEADMVKKRVDECETFHKSYFASHLKREGTHRCNCLACGSSHDPSKSDDVAENTVCPNPEKHRASCEDCAKGFAVLELLEKRLFEKRANYSTTTDGGCGGADSTIADFGQLDDIERELGEARQDLLQYRSDLAQNKTRNDQTIDSIRGTKSAAGLFLCDARCPVTGRYCTCEFLTEKSRDKHTDEGKHHFPSGMNAKDKLMMLAGSPSGSNFAVAGKKSNPIVACAEGAPGEVAARCFGQYNRKPKKRSETAETCPEGEESSGQAKKKQRKSQPRKKSKQQQAAPRSAVAPAWRSTLA